MGKKYANPPIVEVVCEFRLSPDTPWDFTIPGLLYEKLKDEFPHREQRLMQEVKIEQTSEGVQQEIRTSERVLLFDETRKIFVQLGSRLAAVNSLRPYPTWAGFKPKIEKVWQNLIDTVQVKGLERIGLRYINRITLPFAHVDLKRYFSFYPFLGPNLPQTMVSFIVISEFAYHDQRDLCRVQLTSAISESTKTTTFFLDIDYFLTKPKELAIEDALAWVEEAHDQVEAIFEGCITDSLRELFEEVRL